MADQLPSLYDLLTKGSDLMITPSANTHQAAKPKSIYENFNVSDKPLTLKESLKGALKGAEETPKAVAKMAVDPNFFLNQFLENISKGATKAGDVTHLNSMTNALSKVPLIGAVIPPTLGGFLPSNLAEAALFGVPVTKELEPGIKGVLKGLGTNMAKFGAASAGIQGVANIANNQPVTKDMEKALASGGALGVVGTLAPKGLAYIGTATRYLGTKMADTVKNIVPESVANYVSDVHLRTFAKLGTPDTALNTKGINQYFLKYYTAESDASLRANLALKLVEANKDSLIGYAKSVLPNYNVNEHIGAALLIAKKEVPQDLMPLKKEFESLKDVENTKDYYTRYSHTTAIRKQAKKQVPAQDYENYLSTSNSPRFSLMAKTQDVIGTAQKINTPQNFYDAFKNSIVYPAYHHTVENTGKVLSGYRLSDKQGRLLANDIILKYGGYLKEGANAKGLEEVISRFHKATDNISDVYKSIKDYIKTQTPTEIDARRFARSATRYLYNKMGYLDSQSTTESLLKAIDNKQLLLTNYADTLLDNKKISPETYNLIINESFSSNHTPEYLEALNSVNNILQTLNPADKAVKKLILSKFVQGVGKSYYLLTPSKHYASPYLVIDKLINPSVGTFNKVINFVTGIKRLEVSLSPIHVRSLMFSYLIQNGDFAKTLSIAKDMFVSDKTFYEHIKPKLDVLNEMRKEFPQVAYLFGGTADIPRDVKPLLHTAATDWFDKALWDRLYTGLKVDSLTGIYEKYKQGLYTPQQFLAHAENVNNFFGGIPNLKIINPTLWGALRLTFLAPDWEYSLLKQFWNAVTLKDEQSIRFYYNVLAFNTYFNAALGAARGVQPVTSSLGDVAQAVSNGDLGKLFAQTYSIAGHPVSVDVLGYEKEMPTLIYDGLSVPMSIIGSTGDIGTALRTFVRDIANKFAPYPQMISSITNYTNNKPNSGAELLGVWMPFIFKPSITGTSLGEGIIKGVIGSTGMRVYSRKHMATLADLYTSKPNISKEAFNQITQDINQQYANYQKATNTTNAKLVSGEWANLYSNIIYRVNPDIIPKLTNMLYDYKKASASGDASAIQKANEELASVEKPILRQIYRKIKNSAIGEHISNEEVIKITKDVFMFAYHEAKSKSSSQIKANP